ncbi:MAG: 2-oxoacid:ferredoxin oxidoreductase subunit beta [Chloroflexi bacterium]|nr:2-oxoacid:ferredoxin oxidoreductase subunit beta [Chloroflexota bacterium]
MSKTVTDGKHLLDPYLRVERLPHIWCPGCGLGLVVGCFMRALLKSQIPLDKVAVVSGIGCTGRAAGYIKLDSFHTTHGRAIPFATGLKMARPDLKVVLLSGDGDLLSIGGNHLIHAARRNIDMTVVLVNNFNYGMTGGQLGPTTPLTARTTTTRAGNQEEPFNVPALAMAAGAVYVSRWTTAHFRRLEKSIHEALLKKGFSLVEAISPCPTYYGRMNKKPTGLALMQHYRDHSVIKSAPSPVSEDMDGEITVGKFVDIERPYLPAPGGQPA